MPWWLLVILFVASVVISALLQRRPTDAQPSAAGDFQVPTAQEGRAIPVIFGTCISRDPNVVWWGDLRTAPIKRKAGLFKSSIVGYFYFFGMQMAICHGPIDQVVKLLTGTSTAEKIVPGASGVVSGGDGHFDFTVNAPDFFGGDDREGGLRGTIAFYAGKVDQPSDAYLGTKAYGGTAPGWSGLCYCVLKGPGGPSDNPNFPFYFGTSQYIKLLAWVLARWPNNLGLVSGHHKIGTDSNPAEMVYETLTNKRWGLGIPTARIDLASFQAAGEALFTEGMGLSAKLDGEAAADQVLGDWCRHVDGAVFTDPATGLWTLKLARDDYDVDDLLEIDETDVIGVPEVSRPSWEETVNEIKVKFTDRATFKTRIVQAQETANHAVRAGDLVSETINFLGFTSPAIAQKVAMRELKIASYPLMRGKIPVNRKAWPLRIGSVFKFSWAPLGISNMVMRVGNIDYGSPEKPVITLDVMEDIFHVAFTGYAEPSDSAWTDPVTDPQAPEAQRLEEMPYHLAIRS